MPWEKVHRIKTNGHLRVPFEMKCLASKTVSQTAVPHWSLYLEWTPGVRKSWSGSRKNSEALLFSIL